MVLWHPLKVFWVNNSYPVIDTITLYSRRNEYSIYYFLFNVFNEQKKCQAWLSWNGVNYIICPPESAVTFIFLTFCRLQLLLNINTILWHNCLHAYEKKTLETRLKHLPFCCVFCFVLLCCFVLFCFVLFCCVFCFVLLCFVWTQTRLLNMSWQTCGCIVKPAQLNWPFPSWRLWEIEKFLSCFVLVFLACCVLVSAAAWVCIMKQDFGFARYP